jgi:hypothetical protein
MNLKETNITTVSKTKYFKIPYEVFNDTSFPFQEDDKLMLEIKGDEVVVSKKRGDTK